MAILLATGVVIVVIGAVAGGWWLAVIGACLLCIAPFALLVPAMKRESGSKPERAYRDMNFFGGAMTVLGFRPTEQDKAAKEVDGRRERRPD